MSLTPTLAAEYAKSVFTGFVCMELTLLDGGDTLRLLDAASEVTFDGKTFKGSDPDYGSLQTLEPVEEGIALNSPRFRIGLNTYTATGMVTLANPANQGSIIKMWHGAVDFTSGAVLPDPELFLLGRLDRASRSIRRGSEVLELDCSTYWEELFLLDQGERLNNQHHQSIWPGEEGLEYVVNVQRQLPWGTDAPRPAVVADTFTPSGTVAPITGGGFDLSRVLQT